MTALRPFNNQICFGIVLSIVWILSCGGECDGRPDMIAAYVAAGRQDIPRIIMDELLLATANEDALYNELKKYHRQQPNYIGKWPALRDLLLTADYDESAANGESNELLNAHFLERLRQLAASSFVDMTAVREEFTDAFTNINANAVADGDDDGDGDGDYDGNGNGNGNGNGGALTMMTSTDVPLKKIHAVANDGSGTFKDHGIKKNVQYMSPCHFKICNMGRKRNARYLTNFNY